MVPKSFCAGLPLSLSLAYFFSLSVYACVLPSFRGGFIGLPRSYLLKTCWWTHLLLMWSSDWLFKAEAIPQSLPHPCISKRYYALAFVRFMLAVSVFSALTCFCADLSSVPPVTVKACACAHGHTCSSSVHSQKPWLKTLLFVFFLCTKETCK